MAGILEPDHDAQRFGDAREPFDIPQERVETGPCRGVGDHDRRAQRLAEGEPAREGLDRLGRAEIHMRGDREAGEPEPAQETGQLPPLGLGEEILRVTLHIPRRKRQLDMAGASRGHLLGGDRKVVAVENGRVDRDRPAHVLRFLPGCRTRPPPQNGKGSRICEKSSEINPLRPSGGRGWRAEGAAISRPERKLGEPGERKLGEPGEVGSFPRLPHLTLFLSPPKGRRGNPEAIAPRNLFTPRLRRAERSARKGV